MLVVALVKNMYCGFELCNVMLWQVKNISVEILDFYEGHRMVSEERISAAIIKLAMKPESGR